jgi:excinuclease ABC subunit C
LSSRARALDELQRYLGLEESPLRIECYDMSHLQGTDYVGSMVVMEDGLPKRSEYRRFKVSAVQGNDDYGAMHEVLTRRLRRLDETNTSDGKRHRFAYRPQLLLLDGGKGQLSVGEAVVEELGLTGRVALASLAKQFEEVFVPGRTEPIRIPRDSDAIYLLQQIRDEAHRFAITFHRERRGKRMRQGALDNVPGLGQVRRDRLVREMGGVRQVQAASREDLAALEWLCSRTCIRTSPVARGRASRSSLPGCWHKRSNSRRSRNESDAGQRRAESLRSGAMGRACRLVATYLHQGRGSGVRRRDHSDRGPRAR